MRFSIYTRISVIFLIATSQVALTHWKGGAVYTKNDNRYRLLFIGKVERKRLNNFGNRM